MAQAGLHALVGAAFRKLTPRREFLMLGLILGSLLPDLDNYAVAIATLAKLSPDGLHRTFTHSLFAIFAVLVIFTLIGQLRRQPRWTNFGLGLALGIGLHILLDLLIWFNGVELLWPFGGWINFWVTVQPPAWFARLLDPAEFAFLALFLAWLGSAARRYGTDMEFLRTLRVWTIAMLVLLLIFTPLAYLLSKGFMTVFGLFYLVSLTAAFVITIRMRRTMNALA
jgi:membrane-bound metal-dependent hydrolase YbcI (DUF457 family)